jgi:hypothetical protein
MIAEQVMQRTIDAHGNALGASIVILVYLCTCIRLYLFVVIAHEGSRHAVDGGLHPPTVAVVVEGGIGEGG